MCIIMCQGGYYLIGMQPLHHNSIRSSSPGGLWLCVPPGTYVGRRVNHFLTCPNSTPESGARGPKAK